MKNLIVRKNKKGFSLVELLVVIAVIGVIAAIAIPAMSGIFGKSEETKIKRNAQALASTFNAARAAGNQTAYAGVETATKAVITTGGITGSGTFAASTFNAPMTEAERASAAALLTTPTIVTTGATKNDTTFTLSIDPTK